MGALLRHLDLKLHSLSNNHMIVIHQLGDGHRGLWEERRGASRAMHSAETQCSRHKVHNLT